MKKVVNRAKPLVRTRVHIGNFRELKDDSSVPIGWLTKQSEPISIIIILSRVGCVTRLITSRCQGCSDYLLCIHSYTLYSYYRLLYHNYCFHYISANTRLLSAAVSRLCPFLYLRPLLRSKRFVVTVETSIRITIPRLLLPSNGLF
jgi:hypothetical protein